MYGRFPLAPLNTVGTSLEWVNMSVFMQHTPAGPSIGLNINGDPLAVPAESKYGHLLPAIGEMFAWVPYSSAGDDVKVCICNGAALL